MADIIDGHVIVLAPKERHFGKSLFLPKHIFCNSLTLTLGHNPMLDPEVLTCMRVGPARNVSGGIYVRYAGLEVFVDSDAAINFDACAFGQLEPRPHAHANDNHVGWQCRATLEFCVCSFN